MKMRSKLLFLAGKLVGKLSEDENKRHEKLIVLSAKVNELKQKVDNFKKNKNGK